MPLPTLTLAIPYFNQLAETKGCMGLLRHMTTNQTEWLIIDNGSSDPVENFFRDTLRPKRLKFISNDTNQGMVKTYQQIFDQVTTDLVAIIHNDVLVYEPNWDLRIRRIFTQIPQLGSAGFFGSQGVGIIGERIQDPQFPGQMAGISNMLEAEVHGIRLQDQYVPAAILDGFMMIFSMEMIKTIGGLDQQYQYHHLYDRELPLAALAAGYKNIVVNVPCHHLSGVTANNAGYQNWINQTLDHDQADQFTHDHNTNLFRHKWAKYLPIYVESDFSFRTGRHGRWQFQGDAILKAKYK